MRGYSLIELLIALAITAGLGAVSMPLFKQQAESLLLQQASSRWLSYLHQVKAKAQRAEDSIIAELCLSKLVQTCLSWQRSRLIAQQAR